jgi:hypothetical protein
MVAVQMDLPLVGVHGEALRPETIWAEAREVDWQRRSVGGGSKDRRFYDWAVHAVVVKGQPAADGYTNTLLARHTAKPKSTSRYPDGVYEIEYFLVHALVGLFRSRSWSSSNSVQTSIRSSGS